ncbi:hypothetical protein [Halorubrum sp. SY-15]|jgi:hypothetical protein|uniref:hypothetical protein n=1 Tax=Halorubrum sp. SY-15 TaxID=3402277 RepID=UPI003EC00536
MFGDKRGCLSGDDDAERTVASSGAQVGARIGAAVGSRGGPFAAGLASGLGGATGYLVGAVVDDVEASVKSKTPLPDGGQPAAHDGRGAADEDGVAIPVTEE